MARIVAARRTEPPLSVGLFGDWGSGKSFFMRLLRERVRKLADDTVAAEAAGQASAYCGRVVQVEFNAWHYIEHNLWASLVTRIFEGLFGDLAVRARAATAGVESLYDRLHIVEEAERELDVAESTLRAAEQRRTATSVSDVAGPGDDVSRAASQLESTLGHPPAQLDLKQLDDLERNLRTLRGRLTEGFLGLGRQARHRVVLSALAVLALAALGLGVYQLVQRVVPAIGVVVLTTAVATIGAAVSLANAGLRAVDGIVQSERLRELRGAEDVARQRVARAREEYERIRRLQSQTLYRFIEERYASSDYRRQLGIVALIQRDFQRLTDQLLGDPAAGGASEAALPSIDRIVLYVDDLDRCPPDVVVRVLQAVHLLLAFRLFVVVVGVDSRWLLRSVEHEYAAQLGPRTGGGDWSASPQAYLEKIFQIPFWIRPMGEPAYRKLVHETLRHDVAREAPEGVPDGAGQPGTEAAGTAPPEGTAARAEAAATPSPTPAATAALAADLTPAALELLPEEAELIESLGPLVTSPRNAKRLVNIYRLFRVTLRGETLERFLGRGTASPAREYPAVLLLLGILAGFPGPAAVLLSELGHGDEPTWWGLVDRLGTGAGESEEWSRLLAALRTFRSDARLADIAPFTRWADRVARFSFTAGRQVDSSRERRG